MHVHRALWAGVAGSLIAAFFRGFVINRFAVTTAVCRPVKAGAVTAGLARVTVILAHAGYAITETGPTILVVILAYSVITALTAGTKLINIYT